MYVSMYKGPYVCMYVCMYVHKKLGPLVFVCRSVYYVCMYVCMYVLDAALEDHQCLLDLTARRKHQRPTTDIGGHALHCLLSEIVLVISAKHC